MMIFLVFFFGYWVMSEYLMGMVRVRCFLVMDLGIGGKGLVCVSMLRVV